ncbi:hypothetical protein ACFQ6V_23500 [Streptomyces roseifaciens]
MSGEACVRLAARTIEAAWTCGRGFDLATEAAQALRDAGLLQSPEVAAELDELRRMREAVLGLGEALPRALRELEALTDAGPQDGVAYRGFDCDRDLWPLYSNLAGAQDHCDALAARELLLPQDAFKWMDLDRRGSSGQYFLNENGKRGFTAYRVDEVRLAAAFDRGWLR